jgi:glycerol-3-phosphate acyltransferase PlsX
MKIGLDVMGGDFAPDAIIEGAVDTLEHLSADETIVLLGDEASIIRKLNEMNIPRSLFRIFPTTQVIEMGDHPAKAFSQKKDASIAVGWGCLKGHSRRLLQRRKYRAMLVGASCTVNVIPESSGSGYHTSLY